MEIFVKTDRPSELTDKEHKSLVDTNIKQEEVTDYAKELKIVKLNLRKIYTLVFGNCIEGVKFHTYRDTELGKDHSYTTNLKKYLCHQ